MTMQLRDIVEKALAAGQPANSIERTAVYNGVRQRLDRYIAEHLLMLAEHRKRQLREALEREIDEIEGRFSDSFPPRHSNLGDINMTTSITPEPIGEKAGRRNAGWIGAAAGILIVGGIAAYLLYPRGPVVNPDFEKGLEGYSSDLITLLPATSSETLSAATVDNTTVIRATGRTVLYSTAAYPIDINKTYRVVARMRTTADDTTAQGSLNYLGLVAYNREDKMIPFKKGEPRQFLLSRKLNTSNDWQVLEGTIQGAGQNTVGKFPPDTVSVRLPMIINHESQGATTEVDYLRIEEVE